MDSWNKCVKSVKEDMGNNKNSFMMISGPLLKKSLQAYCLIAKRG